MSRKSRKAVSCFKPLNWTELLHKSCPNLGSIVTSKMMLFLSNDDTLSSEPELAICSEDNFVCISGLWRWASRKDGGVADKVLLAAVIPRRSRSSTPPYRATAQSIHSYTYNTQCLLVFAYSNTRTLHY